MDDKTRFDSTGDEVTRIDSPKGGNATPVLDLQKEKKSPKSTKPKISKKALLIAALVVILGGAATCAYFFVPWKTLFGKENARTVYDDDEEEEKVYTGINPFNGQPVPTRKFTIAQINKMNKVEWDPWSLSQEEIESLVLIPEKKVLIGYNMSYGDNVVYINALGPKGGLLLEGEEVIPSDDMEIDLYPSYPVEESVDSVMAVTEISIVDDAPKADSRNNAPAADPYIGVVDVVAPSEAAAVKEEVMVKEEPRAQQTNEVFRTVEQMPSFPGGDAALYRFLGDNMVYPPRAAENGIQGRVVVQFVVQKDGSIGKVEVARGVDPDLDKEAVRVVKKLPAFNPGRNNGVPVSVWYTLPITFKLAN